MSDARRRSPLVPAAYSESLMPALRLTRSSRTARRISNVLMLALVFATLLIMLAPWQQSVSGTGDVLAYSPDQRPQTIQSRVSGRVYRLGDGVFENAKVSKGQLIVEMRDLDEGYSQRLSQQLRDNQRRVEQLNDRLEAMRAIERSLNRPAPLPAAPRSATP